MFQDITRIFSRIGAGLIVLGCLFCISPDLKSQDLHYSQFYNSPIIINPAYTGIFNGDERLMFSFRDQARNIPVPYLTFSASYDRKIYPKSNTKGFYGIGGFFNYNKQGDSNLRLLNFNGAFSYSRILNENNIITLGALIGFSNRGFDPVALTWDSQWDTQNNVFNPSLPSGETFDFESFSYLETGVGLNYRWQKSERTKFDVGIGAFHLQNPSTTYYNGVAESLPVRLSLYGILSAELTEDLDLQLDILHQRQEAYRQLLFGGYLNFYLSHKRGQQRQFRVGAGYKVEGEVLFVKAGLQINEIFVAMSYDMDLSEFGTLDNGAPGKGPEIHFRYIIKHVKPQGRFKVCPIF